MSKENNNSLVPQDNTLSVFNADALTQAFEFSEKLAQSSIIPQALRNKPADIMVVLQTGIELGLSPMLSLRSVDVIHGTPALKPQTMLALIRSKCPNALIEITDNGTDTATVRMARERDYPDEAFTSVWTKDRAQTMGLLGKDNWKKQAITMLRWRAVGEACRMVFPDLIMGLYTSQEVQDFAIDPNEYIPEGGYPDLKEEVQEVKTSLTKDPEKVNSKSSEEEIADVVFKEVGDNTEAVEEAKIIGLIGNRDYIFPLGEHKGKKLYEVPIETLRPYSEAIEAGAKKSAKKTTDAQGALIANLSAYVSKYNTLEKMSPLELDRLIVTENSKNEIEDTAEEIPGGHGQAAEPPAPEEEDPGPAEETAPLTATEIKKPVKESRVDAPIQDSFLSKEIVSKEGLGEGKPRSAKDVKFSLND